MALLSNKKALYLTYDGLTDPLGQSQILPYLIGLAKQNISFVVISFEKPSFYEKYANYIKKQCEDNNVQWIPLRYTKKPPVLSTIYDLFKLKRKAKQVLKEKNINIVHCRSYITSLVGLSLKKRNNVKFIFDMRGFWADERMERNIWNSKNIIYKIIYKYFKYKEKQFLNNSDKIIVLTEAAKNELTKNFENTLHKIEVIPCATSFYENDLLQTKNSTIIKVVYIGSLRTSYLVEEMFLFFKLFKNKHPNAVFYIYTIEEKNYLQPFILKHQLKGSELKVEDLKQSDVNTKLKECDLGICFIKQTYSGIASSPTKFAEMLAANIPVVCNNIGDLKEHCQQIPYTYCFDELNEETFKEFINNFKFPDDCERKKISEESKKIYDLKLAIDKYFKVYQSLYD